MKSLNSFKIGSIIISLLFLAFFNRIKIFSRYIRQINNINNLSLEVIDYCPSLQKRLEEYTDRFVDSISLSVLHPNGFYIADINGEKPRIPASNQKLISSAYAIEKLGPDHTLDTTLIKDNGKFIIYGNGDPDLNKRQLDKLVDKLVSTHIKYNKSEKVKLILKEEAMANWRIDSWSKYDKTKEYAAPITRLALLSNHSNASLIDPIEEFKRTIKTKINLKQLEVDTTIHTNKNSFTVNNDNIIFKIRSAPLYALLNLVNSESHNFTSEVLFKNAIRSWGTVSDNSSYYKWSKFMGLSEKHVFTDASGLSRDNKLTTRGITNFLRRMNEHRYSEYYFSSFSILGLRGTLSNINHPLSLTGRFMGKSGTLNRVKSISGVLKSNNDNLIVSIIINGLDESLFHLINILSIIDKSQEC